MRVDEHRVLALVARAHELTETLLEDLLAGRLDRLDRTLDEREVALSEMRDLLRTLGDRVPPEVRARMQTLRDRDAEVRAQLLVEKQEVLRGLGAVRGRRVDPYHHDGIEGPVAVDRRG